MISVIFQLIVFLCFGALADYGDLRKIMFMACNTVACIACACIIFGGANNMFSFNAAMMIIANLLFGFCTVFYNAYLPLLVSTHPDYIEVAEK